jgi:hypothetical protein
LSIAALEDYFFEEKNEKGIKLCEKCGTRMPEHVVICWGCGNIMDESLKRLVAMKKKKQD